MKIKIAKKAIMATIAKLPGASARAGLFCTYILSGLICCGMILTGCSESSSETAQQTIVSKVIESTDGSFDQQLASFNGPIMVDFYADWCVPCRHLAPIMEDLSTSSEFGDKVKFMRVNVDKCPETTQRFSVTNLPEVVIFTHGKPFDGSVGLPPQVVLEDRLTKALASLDKKSNTPNTPNTPNTANTTTVAN